MEERKIVTVFRYKEEKSRLTEETNETVHENKETVALIRARGELFVRVRSSLQQLAEKLRIVTLPGSAPPSKKPGKARTTYGEIIPIIKPEAVEIDGRYFVLFLEFFVIFLLCASF